MVADFFMYLGAAALVIGAAGGISWLGVTAWAWVERSDAERGFPFLMWLRMRR